MKLSISNIGWDSVYDSKVYELMKKNGLCGLEIAPTRIFPENPYEKIDEVKIWYENLKKEYGFEISSMQSIWYGRQEKLFGTDKEREELLIYTKKAIDFAVAIGCRNLVFGCPKNRNKLDKVDDNIAIEFFKQIGDYAEKCGTVIGMEANPTIYGTNYINDTAAALKLIKNVNSKGFLLNLDIGTMIQNKEDVEELVGQVKYINHVHVSEPNLKPIEERDLHQKLKDIIEKENYDGYISIEVSKNDDIKEIEKNMEYVKAVFKDDMK